MLIRLLEFLRCPECKKELSLKIYESSAIDASEIRAGLLACACGRFYPIWKGIPRMFLDERGFPMGFAEHYKKLLIQDIPLFADRVPKNRNENFSFSHQWSMYEYGELTWEVEVSKRVDFFYRYLAMPPGSLKSNIVLDAGCGNGTLSAAIAASGVEVVAMDYSTSVESAEKNKTKFAGNYANKVHYVQGDLQKPPFANKCFDVIYSDGVLHHTPDTRKSFNILASLVKKDGLLFVWLYRSDLSLACAIKSSIINGIRFILKPFPYAFKQAFCFSCATVLLTLLSIRHLLGLGGRRIIPVRLKATNLFDTFTPEYVHRHLPSEVKKWFEETGFSKIQETTIPELGHWGFGMLGKKT